MKIIFLAIFLSTVGFSQNFQCKPDKGYHPAPKKRFTTPTVNESLVYLRLGCSGGCSGFIVGKNLILTSAHCMNDSPFVFVNFSDGKMAEGKLIKIGNWEKGIANDWAVLIADTSNRMPLKLSSKSPDKGEKGVDLTCGGEKWPQQQTLPIRFIGRDIEQEFNTPYLGFVGKTDHGDSGSPVLNHKGEVVGVVSELDPLNYNLGKATPLDNILPALNVFKIPH